MNKPEEICFGQLLGTLYYHLEESLLDNAKYEIVELNINEEKRTGTAIIKTSNKANSIWEEWVFNSELDIWIRERVNISTDKGRIWRTLLKGEPNE